MKTHKFAKLKVGLLVTTALLVACEPPTPASLSKAIPAFTRQMDLVNWGARLSFLNVWGLPVISKKKKERMPAIGTAVAQRNPDVALFQEAWLDEGRQGIFKNSGFEFLYSPFIKAPLGSGTMILTHNGISSSSFRPFQLFGPVLLPDAWAVKGVGKATTTIRDLPVSLFSTHLMAGLSRGKQPRSPFTPEWKGEMFELIAHVIEQTDSDAFVIGGDFNIDMNDEEYGFWKRMTSLEGTFLQEGFGDCTYCPTQNNYAVGKNDHQIDFLFVSPRLHFQKAWVDFKEKIEVDGKQVNLSDHYGLGADIFAHQGDTQSTPVTVRENFRNSLTELRADLEGYLKEKIEEDKEIRERMQTESLDKRLCLSCRVEDTLKMVTKYEHALDQQPLALTPEENVIRVRLESYFDLWR